MIVIEKNKTNKVIVTITEKKHSLSGDTILFHLVNDTTKEEKSFIAADVSVLPTRYNHFNIEENFTEDLPNGVVHLTAGFYTYSIYQQSSTSNLDYTLASKLLEVGKCFVSGDENNIASIYL